jgi:hypothetical protein
VSHVEELLTEILEELRVQRRQSHSPLGFDWNTLLALPDHLRKTIMVVAQQGRVTADEIAVVTHRARALESSYCNQLVVQGLLKKERVGRKAYFMPSLAK